MLVVLCMGLWSRAEECGEAPWKACSGAHQQSGHHWDFLGLQFWVGDGPESQPENATYSSLPATSVSPILLPMQEPRNAGR